MLTIEIKELFINSLNETRYYDAHEILEDLWYPVRFNKNAEVFLLKGLINASVAFELYKKGRAHKAHIPWKAFLKYSNYLQAVSYSNPHYRTLDQHIWQINATLTPPLPASYLNYTAPAY